MDLMTLEAATEIASSYRKWKRHSDNVVVLPPWRETTLDERIAFLARGELGERWKNLIYPTDMPRDRRRSVALSRALSLPPRAIGPPPTPLHQPRLALRTTRRYGWISKGAIGASEGSCRWS